MLSHTLNAVAQNLPLGGHMSGVGWAESGKRGQNFMEEKKEGRNGQVVNFSQVFTVAKWRRVLSALLFWENWKAELPNFNSCNYGLSWGDAFLPSKQSIVSTYGPLHLTLFCNNFEQWAYELSASQALVFPQLGKVIFNWSDLLEVAYTDKSHREIIAQPEKELYGSSGTRLVGMSLYRNSNWLKPNPRGSDAILTSETLAYSHHDLFKWGPERQSIYSALSNTAGFLPDA